MHTTKLYNPNPEPHSLSFLLLCRPCLIQTFTKPNSGFCRHQVPGFGPWHRAYLRQFELALLDSAKVAASAFTDEALRTQFTAVAEAIRLPYYDWTNPRVPDILTASRVTVLDTETGQPTQIRNPLGAYEYTVSVTVFFCDMLRFFGGKVTSR